MQIDVSEVWQKQANKKRKWKSYSLLLGIYHFAQHTVNCNKLKAFPVPQFPHFFNFAVLPAESLQVCSSFSRVFARVC